MCNSTTGFGLIDRPIDLFHDTRHLCTRFTVDGIKATFPCFLRGQTEFAGTGNGGRVCLFSQNETTILVMQNVQISFVKFYVIIEGRFGGRHEACIQRHIDHFHPSSSLKLKVLHLLLSRMNLSNGRKIALLFSYHFFPKTVKVIGFNKSFPLVSKTFL